MVLKNVHAEYSLSFISARHLEEGGKMNYTQRVPHN
jgi:hypothetical protein